MNRKSSKEGKRMKFQAPQMEITRFSVEDVITTSNGVVEPVTERITDKTILYGINTNS